MSRFRVVLTDQVYPDVNIERGILNEVDAELVVPETGIDHVLAAARGADALLNAFLPIDGHFIGQLRRCRVIARYGIGVDNIDVDAASASGIVVTNVPDYCVEEVASHTVAMLLGVLRKIPDADAAVRGGRWGVFTVAPVPRLSSLTIGLVGYGRIARRVARALEPFGPRLVCHDPYADPATDDIEPIDLDELFATCHAVLLHCPLTAETRSLVNAERLARMRRDAVLVNTSRGPLVVLDDLLVALRGGVIAGAALDVFDHEPPDPEVFDGVPGLILSPHTAFYSEQAVRESQRKAATQVRAVLGDDPPDYAVNWIDARPGRSGG